MWEERQKKNGAKHHESQPRPFTLCLEIALGSVTNELELKVSDKKKGYSPANEWHRTAYRLRDEYNK